MSGNGTQELPPGWVTTTLGELIALNPHGWESELSDDEIVSFVPMAAVEAGSGKMDASQHRLWREVKKGYTTFQEGDVLFAKITPCMENGKCAIAQGLMGRRAAGSTEFHILRPTQVISAKLLLYFILQETLRREAKSRMKGAAGQLRVPPEFLREVSFRLAPLPEQHRIVAEIEKQFTRLDAGVAALERARTNLKRYRASVLKAACEGRLVPNEAELARKEGRDYEPAEQLLARILKERYAKWEADQLAKMQAQGKAPKDGKWKEKYQEPVAPDTTNLPELPEGWVWATVERLASSEPNALTDGPFGSNLKTSHYTSTGPRVIRLQNIGDGVFIDAYAHISQQHYESLEKHHIQTGDLVIAALGEKPPRACIIPPLVGPAIVKADCIRFKPEPRMALPQFLNCALNAEPTRARTASIVHGVGRPRLNLGEIRAIILPLSPLVEQTRIVAEVERRLSVIDELKATIDTDLKRAERLRQSILKRAFEGKLAPQDPNDEPASVLLERIRAERQGETNAMVKVVSKPRQKIRKPQITATQPELFR